MVANDKPKIKETKTRYGVMHYYADDQYIGHALEKYGEYSEGEPDLWRLFLNRGDVAIDIGANIGALTLALSEIVGPEGVVQAFEPQPENYELLKKNLAKRTNVIPNLIALSDSPGTMVVPSLKSLHHNNYGGVELLSDKPDATYRDVEVSTLDGIAHPHNVAFIKIDVEGMEAKVLRGAEKTIKEDRPVLYVENDRKEKSEELLRLLHRLGYCIYQHQPLLYTNNNFKRVEVTEPNVMSINLLCVPKERDSEFKTQGIVDGLQRLTSETPKRSTNTRKDWACVVRLGGIGDNLIAASTLRPLKEQGYMIEVISQGIQSVVFENNPFVDKLTVKSQKEIPQDNPVAWQKYWWARSCEYAKFVNLSHSVEVLMAQFPQSTAFWWPPEFRRKLCSQSYLEAAHDVVGVPHDFGPLFFPTDEEVEDIRDFKARNGFDKKPLIAWVISGTRVDKLYPFAAMAISRLLSEVDCNVIMLSAPSPQRPDANHAEQIMNHVKLTNSSTRGLYEARHVEGAHNWPIRRMLALAMQTDLVIGPDTGVMWAVAMEDMPKIMLHSHASADNITKHWNKTVSLKPNQTNVPCWPCHLLHDGIDTCQETQIQAGMTPKQDDPGAACISAIPVQQLLLAAKGVLGHVDFLSQLRNDFGSLTVLR